MLGHVILPDVGILPDGLGDGVPPLPAIIASTSCRVVGDKNFAQAPGFVPVFQPVHLAARRDMREIL
jgi:hypothetical protein